MCSWLKPHRQWRDLAAVRRLWTKQANGVEVDGQRGDDLDVDPVCGGVLVEAGLSAVEGAVVLTKRVEVLEFGAEISGTLTDVGEVYRALVREGVEVARESTTAVGIRHRFEYRLCERIPDLLAIVISQDSGVRIVRNSSKLYRLPADERAKSVGARLAVREVSGDS